MAPTVLAVVEADDVDVMPRVRLEVAGHAGAVFSLTGHDDAGTTWAVRGGQTITPNTDPELVRDYEAPFGVPIYYTAKVGAATVTSNVVEIDADGAWVYDPNLPGAGVRVAISEVPTVEWQLGGSLITVIGRDEPVPITRPMVGPGGRLALRCHDVELPPLLDVITSGEAILIRSCLPYLLTRWVIPTRVTVRPAGPDRTVRSVELEAGTVPRPTGGITLPPEDVTWDGIVAGFATWDALVAGRTDWLEVMREGPP